MPDLLLSLLLIPACPILAPNFGGHSPVHRLGFGQPLGGYKLTTGAMTWTYLAERYKLHQNIMAVRTNDVASDFGGHSPVHRHRLRPISRGLQDDDRGDGTDMRTGTDKGTPGSELSQGYKFYMPFEAQPCELCRESKKGNYLLLNVNNAVHHLKTHHPGATSSFECSRCGKVYKTKHAAQCHLPKCPGIPEVVIDGITCESCGQIFRTQRGLSQHERTAHPESRNQKRRNAAQPAQARPEAKGYGKIWSKDIDTRG